MPYETEHPEVDTQNPETIKDPDHPDWHPDLDEEDTES
jgi:hypothetical protein